MSVPNEALEELAEDLDQPATGHIADHIRSLIAAHKEEPVRLCPIEHGAEHEMDLVWYCETCGYREEAEAALAQEGEKK